MTLHPPSGPSQWPFRRVMWATLVLVFIVFGFWLLLLIYQVVFILFIAIVIGTVLRPAVTWLHQRGLPRIAGAVLVFLLLLALLIGFVLVLFPLIVEQGTTIAAAVPGTIRSPRESMINSAIQMIMRLSEFLPATLPGLGATQQTGQQMLTFAGQCRAEFAGHRAFRCLESPAETSDASNPRAETRRPDAATCFSA